MLEPLAVREAMIADSLAQRYGKFPTEVLEADVRNLQIAEIVRLMSEKPNG